VIFFSGPVGAGKTTLGRAVAAELGASFVDVDDLGDPSKRWFEEVLTVSRELVRVGMTALADRPVLIVARPLRARDWAFFRRRFEAESVAVHCVTLKASLDAIVDPDRGRVFSLEERARIEQMIAQGYADRPFGDAIVETDRAGFAATVAKLTEECRRALASGRGLPAKPAAGPAPRPAARRASRCPAPISRSR
jgi:hypothetical protein